MVKRTALPPRMGIANIRPTMYFVAKPGRLRQQVELTVVVPRNASCVVRIEGPGFQEDHPVEVPFGDGTYAGF